MPGHNYIESINEGTLRSQGGKTIQIGAFGAITNSGGAIPAGQAGVDYQGFARGAMLINTTGTSTSNTVYINLGTTATATWTALTVS
jgi:hypothetical protein